MIQVKYFGVIAEAAQRDSEQLKVEQMTLSQVLTDLATKYNLGEYNFQIALNRKIVSNYYDQEIAEGDEIAFLPPFSGG